MYQGYRLKIGDNTISNLDMAKGSYSQKKAERVVDSWFDGNRKEHYAVTPDKKTTISFAFREHELKDHSRFANMTKKREQLSVEYWDDEISDYKIGIFRMEDVTFPHRRITNNNIYYDKTNIVLVEY